MFRNATRIALIATASSCATESPAGTPVRETLPNGATLIRYPDLPPTDSVGPEVTEVHVDLQFGSREGDDPNLTFGRIQGIQAGSDGTIYVLDGQPDDVRVFSPDGEYLRTIVRRGEGPGETTGASGIILSGDTLLWMDDRRGVIGVDPNGEEVRRFKRLAYDPAYYWSGAFDNYGRYWIGAYHADEERSGDLTRASAGPHTETYLRYYKSYDLSTEAIDSVPLGERVTQTYLFDIGGGGLGFMDIPFVSSDVTAVRPAGGFWHSGNTAYRITRSSEQGDTLVVIEAALPALPVTPEERSAYMDRTVDRHPGQRSAAERAAAVIADFKPIFHSFFVDDEDRLWARRTTPNGAHPFYDLFSEAGDYLGSVRLGFPPARGSRVWVRHGNLYTWVLDDLDVQYVVRAPVS